ncbi:MULTISPECIES: PBECR2 nuclease fold domain-containing protein [Bacillus]|uniref:Plasmid-related protein n=2 Tax=Bacillus thuringiensis TaxID=1428 RepID=Q45786_BACTU|nr:MULTISPECIES: PBECR2 nuclease fold domain-containing protein [Bacillus]AEA19194.1 spbB [Bacillus thuringiensis serovar chinensis CT-43]AFV22165.1 SpbB protein SpbB [Bacillus thuringiensis Bt407]ARV91414.1 plasmid-related protein [Bacillus thuringiensis]ERH96623.1 hypothetical protein BTCBT_007233 [Bacillus thuringiensis T01-328]MBG9624125.1 plasmid-related protein [Bacillus thuringiensis]
MTANKKKIVNKPTVVAKLPQIIIDTYNLTCTSNDVKMFPGFIKHVKKQHPGIYEKYSSHIKDIVEHPDYVGQNPKEPNSVELVKILNDHILIAIKLDPSGYLFLSTMFDLKNGPAKIQRRLNSGRLIAYKDLLS